MHYIVEKVGKTWKITHEGTEIGGYPAKGQAVLTARLLAGWAGSVTMVRA